MSCPNQRKPDITRKYARKWGNFFAVPVLWLTTVAFLESSHNPCKVNMLRESKGGAWGLMQQMADETPYKLGKLLQSRKGKLPRVQYTAAKWTGEPGDLLDPDLNMMLAAWQLSRLRSQFSDFETVIAAYHQGAPAVKRRLRRGRRALSPRRHPRGYDYVQRAIVARDFLLSKRSAS